MSNNKQKCYYIAADKDGSVWLYPEKPKRSKKTESWTFDKSVEFIQLDRSELPEDINPQWSDKTPIRVTITITKNA